MPSVEREELEGTLRALCGQGEFGRAVELAIQGYGEELLRLLAAILRDPERAQDAFGELSEDLVRGLSTFRWESSFRTWAYRLARNICYEFLRSPVARERPASWIVPDDEIQVERSGTRPWQKTDVKERFRDLRERLELEDRMLLILRVDRRMSWAEIARVLAGPEESKSEQALLRKGTALRQQFQRLKARLRALAREEGLVPLEEAAG